MHGRIKTITNERGFGFITAEDGQDYFFHRTDVERSSDGGGFDSLARGDAVQFSPIEPPPAKGLRASVVKANEAATAA